MSQYPQPLPDRLVALLRGQSEPCALALLSQARGSDKTYVMLLAITTQQEAIAWAKRKDMLFGVSALSYLADAGALLAIAVRIDNDPDTAFYIALDALEEHDLEIIETLLAVNELMIGFAAFDGQLYGVKGVPWVSRSQAAIAAYIHTAAAHNAPLIAARSYDFAAAVAEFDAHYEARNNYQ